MAKLQYVEDHIMLRQITEESWWRHQMDTFSALLTLCERNSPITGEFLSQGPVSRSFYVFFDLSPNKRSSKQSWAGDLRRHRAHYGVSIMCDDEIIMYWSIWWCCRCRKIWCIWRICRRWWQRVYVGCTHLNCHATSYKIDYIQQPSIIWPLW